MTTRLRLDDAGADQVRGQLVGFIAGVWAVAALVAIAAPEMVTGSDPTRLPIAALLAPIAASALTGGACELARRSWRKGGAGPPHGRLLDPVSRPGLRSAGTTSSL